MADAVLEQRVTNLENMMAALIEETARLSREMREFKDEMRLNNERREADLKAYRREWRQQYGEMSNKMGTLAEDLVAPSLPRILKEVGSCPPDEAVSLAVRVRRAHSVNRGLTQEFDAIASCGQTVLFNETKTRLSPGDVDRLLEKLATVRDYFPEVQSLQVIGAVASLYVDPSLVQYATRQGVLALGTGDELMEVLNGPELALRRF